MKQFIKKFLVFAKNIFVKTPNKTYWQKTMQIVGPAVKEDFDKTGQKQTRDAIEKFIINHSNRNTLLLDAGCNTAIEGYRLFNKKYKGNYYGVDSNPRAINFAKYNLSEYKKNLLVVSDLEKLPFKNKFFEIVLIKDIIEHQRYYENILTELVRVAKKYLILSLFIKLTDKDEDVIKIHKDGYYLNKYSKKLLFNFFSNNGFKKPKSIYTDSQDEVLVFERKALV